MTELSEARARAVEARDEARNHVEKFPISEGDAVRVARLADVIDALLAASAPVEGDEREALTRSDDDIMITIRHEGGNTLRGTVQQVCGTHLAKGWSLEAGPERRTPLRRTSTPTEEDEKYLAQALYRVLFDAGVSFESNKVIPLLTAAARVALRPVPEEDMKRAAVALIEFDGYDASNPDWSHGFYSFYMEKVRAALSAVHPEVTQ